MKLKIATWNISCGIPLMWDIKSGVKKENDYQKFGLIDEVIQKINDENIDIIGIQESVSFKNKSDSYAKIISNKTKLKYYTEFIVSDCHLVNDAYIEEVVLSKYPIENITNVMFENMLLTKKSIDGKIYKLFDDGFITCDIKINDNKKIKFITGHGPAFDVFNKTYEDYPHIYDSLDKNIEIFGKDNLDIILVGDYNTPNFINMTNYIKNNFRGVITGSTFYDNTLRDYILLSKNFNYIKSYKLNNKSDHLLCICEIEI